MGGDSFIGRDGMVGLSFIGSLIIEGRGEAAPR